MTTTLKCRGWGLAVLLALWCGPAAWGVEVRPPLENAITQALAKKITVRFHETPLEDAVRRLANEAAVPFRIRVEALQDEGIDPQTPVTANLPEMPIGTALRNVLDPLALSYDTREDRLLITTAVDHDERFTDRMFDVSQLVELMKPRLQSIEMQPHFEEQAGQATVQEPLAAGGNEAASAGPFGGVCLGVDGFGEGFGGEHKPAPYRILLEPAQPRFPAEYVLMTIIQENTSGQWVGVDGVGGTMVSGLGRIQMRQTEKVQREAFVLLTNLEQMLREPKKHSPLRLGESDTDRQRRAALNFVLDTISAASAKTIPLEQWIDDNLNLRGVPTTFDRAALEDEGMEWDKFTITLTPGVTRRQLLQDALDEAGLDLIYVGEHHVVVPCVSCPGCAVHSTKVYDISDLPEAGDFDWLVKYLERTTSAMWESVDGVGGTASMQTISGLLFVRQTEQAQEEIAERLNALRQPRDVAAKPLLPERMQSVYALPDIATATDLQAVLPKLVDLPDATWPEGSIHRVGAMLVVQQTEFVHRRIEKVVGAIRQAQEVNQPRATNP